MCLFKLGVHVSPLRPLFFSRSPAPQCDHCPLSTPPAIRTQSERDNTWDDGDPGRRTRDAGTSIPPFFSYSSLSLPHPSHEKGCDNTRGGPGCGRRRAHVGLTPYVFIMCVSHYLFFPPYSYPPDSPTHTERPTTMTLGATMTTLGATTTTLGVTTTTLGATTTTTQKRPVQTVT